MRAWLGSLAMLLVACGGSSEKSARPALFIDEVEQAATVTVTGTRLALSIEVVTAVPGIFEAQLSKITQQIDLVSVPDDDPTKYDIALVAACSREIVLSLELGGQPVTEETAGTQTSYHTLSTDGCSMQPNALVLSGQTNISSIDATGIELAVLFRLARGAESHDLAVRKVTLDF